MFFTETKCKICFICMCKIQSNVMKISTFLWSSQKSKVSFGAFSAVSTFFIRRKKHFLQKKAISSSRIGWNFVCGLPSTSQIWTQKLVKSDIRFQKCR